MSRQYFGDPGHRPGCRGATHDPDWTVHRAIASYLSKEPTFDGVTVAKLAAALGYPEQQIDDALWVLGNGGEAELVTRHPVPRWCATTWSPQVASGRPPRPANLTVWPTRSWVRFSTPSAAGRGCPFS